MKKHLFGVVAILGPANAGKSTLLNRILGQKLTIVSPKPQTTRNKISGILTSADSQIVFLDTPGFTLRRNRLLSLLRRDIIRAVDESDLVLLIIDGAKAAINIHKRLFAKELEALQQIAQDANLPVFLAINKIDKVKDKRNLLPLMDFLSQKWPKAQIIPISAAKGDGVNELLKLLQANLPQGDNIYPEDQLSTVSVRFMVAEIIREKLFNFMNEELPYGMAVEIDSWEEPDGGDNLIIAAIIIVDREAHIGMVIGRGGQMIKEIGQAARRDIGALLEKKVHLDLTVKARPGWVEDQNFLARLGFGAD